jgi:hypothetical protein
MVCLKALFVLFASSTMVLATNGGRRNWSQNTWNNAPKEEQNDCSGRGGFYIKTGTNKELCCSEKTRIPPKDIHCPRGWSQHKRNGVCVPPVSCCCPCRAESITRLLMDLVNSNLLPIVIARKDTTGTATTGSVIKTRLPSVNRMNGMSFVLPSELSSYTNLNCFQVPQAI